ncbi:hypothetical protein N7478_007525 [Penicillium angulare]|uniref:uncharacterized protein n=1 Tax=Penicillium angulare TaxID=116970 RepID=UPI0025420AF8|nr:uncharacterized protein N7478_007525 [Penicillium angulare]KAJ5272400.1 hypothetical protein N7478_007525 [Penicillium angulare]
MTDLDIAIDYPNRLYAPGDSITGSVHGWDPWTNQGFLEISLQGRSKSYIQPGGGVVNKSRSLLTYQTTRLEASDYVGSTITPFSLTVPLSVETNPSNSAKNINEGRSYWRHSWPDDPAFECSDVHPLPPSINMPRRASRGDPAVAWGTIKFKVTATVFMGDGDQTSKMKSYPEMVRITGPYVTVEDLEANMDVMQLSKGLLGIDQNPTKRKSFSSRIKSAFKSTQRIWLAPTVKVPIYAVIGEKVEISIQMELSGITPGFEFPLVSLHRVTVRLCDSLGVRGKQTPLGGTHELLLPGAASATKSWTPRHQFTPAGDGKSYSDAPCKVTFEIPRGCVPTFKTYNLFMRWNFLVEMVFRSLDQEKVTEVRCNIDLVPRLRGITVDEDLEGEDFLDLEVPSANLTVPGHSGESDFLGGIGDMMQGFSS